MEALQPTDKAAKQTEDNTEEKPPLEDKELTKPCEAVQADDFTCPRLQQGRIHQHHESKELTWVPFVSERWGNVLSPYWQARGAAHLSGYNFSCQAFGRHTWMEHLPTSVRADPQVCPNREAFAMMCHDPGPKCDSMEYAHKCVGAWNHIVPALARDTRRALELAADGVQLATWSDSDLVVYDRCASDTVGSHDEHAPVGFSAYKLVPQWVQRIFYVFDNVTRKEPQCNQIREARIAYIQRLLPHAHIHLSAGTRQEDFTKLVFAPNVFVAAQGSSFALWATLANIGQVWMPILYGGMAPYIGPRYTWLTDVPLFTPAVCRQLNISESALAQSGPQIIEWLVNH